MRVLLAVALLMMCGCAKKSPFKGPSVEGAIYVASGWTDAPGCGTAERPCGTISHAIDLLPLAGGQIFVSSGSYPFPNKPIRVPAKTKITGVPQQR